MGKLSSMPRGARASMRCLGVESEGCCGYQARCYGAVAALLRRCYGAVAARLRQRPPLPLLAYADACLAVAAVAIVVVGAVCVVPRTSIGIFIVASAARAWFRFMMFWLHRMSRTHSLAAAAANALHSSQGHI